MQGAFKQTAILVAMIAVLTVLAGCGVAVPDTRGMTVAQASNAIEAAGFRVGQVTYDEHAAEPVGVVVAQQPSAGGRAKEAALVILTVAGPPPVDTPDLRGLDRSNAEAAIAAAGLSLGEVGESYDATIVLGVLVSQEPTAGVQTPRGSTVALVLSKGPRPVVVPNVKGKAQTEAEKLLGAAGFSVKSKQKDSAAKKGTVIVQEPSGGKAQPGSTVTITMSSGVSYVRVPDLCALGGEYDLGDGASAVFSEPRHYGVSGRLGTYRKIAEEAGVKVKFVYADDIPGSFDGGMNSWPRGQSPAPGSQARRGSTVRLVVFE